MTDALIVSDIHNRIAVVDAILAKHPEIKNRIFVGDVYDDFGDNVETIIRVARWHKRMMEDPANIFLLGNHDVSYMMPEFYKCSGWSGSKNFAINTYNPTREWLKYSRFVIERNGWVLSHAGIHRSFWNEGKTVQENVADLEARCRRAMKDDRPEPVLWAGWSRGGTQPYGGLTWLDWLCEWDSPPNVKQIVGHTPLGVPLQNKGSWNLDTHSKHYGILRDYGVFTKKHGALEIHSVD